jgi:hypothetical protein
MLILAPQKVELETLLLGFTQCGCECRPFNIGRMEAWTIPTLNFTLATAGHGKAQFAVGQRVRHTSAIPKGAGDDRRQIDRVEVSHRGSEAGHVSQLR